MPLAAFVFRARNDTQQDQTLVLGGTDPNPVGYDAEGENLTLNNPRFGSNVNEVMAEGSTCGLFMRVVPGDEPTLDKPVTCTRCPI